ncbi:MAG: hypothetical protein KDD69_06445 [Bdellovibrionales bacterium]|nr:hypothetical protein [Bdellovibrionales bacterium]
MFRAVIPLICLTGVLLVGCEKKAPEYRAKIEMGAEAVQHFDQMEDQPKYMHVKKDVADKKRAILDRRMQREKSRGIYRKQSPWDY